MNYIEEEDEERLLAKKNYEKPFRVQQTSKGNSRKKQPIRQGNAQSQGVEVIVHGLEVSHRESRLYWPVVSISILM